MSGGLAMRTCFSGLDPVVLMESGWEVGGGLAGMLLWAASALIFLLNGFDIRGTREPCVAHQGALVAEDHLQCRKSAMS